MKLKDEGAFRNAFKEATKDMTSQQAGKMLVWFVIIATAINATFYLGISWLTLLAVNVLYGPIIDIGFTQVFALAWVFYIVNYFIGKLRSEK